MNNLEQIKEENMKNNLIIENGTKLSENNNQTSFTLCFIFENGKQLNIDIKNEDVIFGQVIQELNSKYVWLKNINISKFLINENIIDPNKSVKQNGIKNNSMITIICKKINK